MKITTENCVDLIVRIIGGTTAEWKRISKKNTPDGIERIFANRVSGQNVRILENDGEIRLAGASIVPVPEISEQPWHTLSDPFEAFKANPITVNFRTVGETVVFDYDEDENEDDKATLFFSVAALDAGWMDDGGGDFSDAVQKLVEELFKDIKGFSYAAEVMVEMPVWGLIVTYATTLVATIISLIAVTKNKHGDYGFSQPQSYFKSSFRCRSRW